MLHPGSCISLWPVLLHRDGQLMVVGTPVSWRGLVEAGAAL